MRERNSLGYVIGVSGEEPKLVHGRDPAGRLIFIGDAASGSACGLICPECAAPLVAKKGHVNAHHFAHAAGATQCNEEMAAETQAHRFSKSALQRASLLLPSFEYLGEAGPLVEIREAQIEVAVEDIRPDVLCEVVWNSNDVRVPTRLVPLAVEIKVTHAVCFAKAARFAALGLRSIEIDLAPYRNKDDQAIIAAVRSSAQRRWIWKNGTMPVKRPEWPSGAVPRNRRITMPPLPASEFGPSAYRDFDRRHPPSQPREDG